MAAPTVGTIKTSRNSSTSSTFTISYPDSVTAGRTLVCIIAQNSNSAGSKYSSNTGGFSVVASDRSITILSKEAGGSEDGTTFTVTMTSSYRFVAFCFELTGSNGVGYASTFDADLDSQTVTPGPGADDYLFIAIGTTRRNDNSFTTAPSGGYGSITQLSSTGADSDTTTNQVRAAIAFFESTAASSSNPGLWGTSGNLDGTSSVAVAFAPAAAADPTISGFSTKLESGQALTITGTNFGATKGSGSVILSDTNLSSSVNAATQTIVDVGDWSNTAITVDSATLPTGSGPGDTVYVFVTDNALTESDPSTIVVADMCLRLGSGTLADTIKDTDTGTDIASESLARAVILSGAAGSTTLVDEYITATITAGVCEIEDAAHFNITTEDDTFLVAIEGAGANRYGLLPAKVVDRNEDP